MIIAIDPSYDKAVGIAWLDKQGKLFFKSVELDKEDKKPATRNLGRIANKIYSFIMKEIMAPIFPLKDERVIIAIESQWFGVNPKMTMTLVELRGMIEGMIYLFFEDKIKIVSVNPREWQSEILHAGRMKSEEIKKKSVKYASNLTRKEVSEDEADAICILKHVEKQWI